MSKSSLKDTTIENLDVMVRYLRFSTSLGSFNVELYTQHVPQTCKYFSDLALSGYYNDTLIHTIQPNHVFIGGDPTNTGKGGKEWNGYLEEIPTSKLKHTGAGIIGMCENSQFYVTLAPSPWNDGKYLPFGRICKDMKTIKSISLIPVGGNSKGNEGEDSTTPLEDILIYSIEEIDSIGEEQE